MRPLSSICGFNPGEHSQSLMCEPVSHRRVCGSFHCGQCQMEVISLLREGASPLGKSIFEGLDLVERRRRMHTTSFLRVLEFRWLIYRRSGVTQGKLDLDIGRGLRFLGPRGCCAMRSCAQSAADKVTAVRRRRMLPMS